MDANADTSDKNQSPPPLFRLEFEDGSLFELPNEWEDVFVDSYGQNPKVYARLAERVRFVLGKYIEHQAWPSKFDGIDMEEGEGDTKFDEDDFYWERWVDWGEAGREWDGRKILKPTWAEIAEAMLYQSMRRGILQEALDEMATKEGQKQARVVTPEEFLDELNRKK
jgi:hypothetical protein